MTDKESSAGKCSWSPDGDGVYLTGCENCFEITEGTPQDNGFKFCVYCGKEIDASEWKDEDEDEHPE